MYVWKIHNMTVLITNLTLVQLLFIDMVRNTSWFTSDYRYQTINIGNHGSN